MASSPIYPGEHIIDDSTPEDHSVLVVPQGFSKGLDYSTRSAEGYAGVADPFPSDLIIPKSEWQARIKEKEDRQTRLSDIAKQAGLKSKDQNGTNYCWMNGPVGCLELVRAVENEPYVELSPASAAAQIKNYRNQGGWGREAIEWLQEHGVCSVQTWPANAIDRQYCTPEAKQEALKYRVAKWYALDNSDEQIVSAVLRNMPVAIGLSWWQHEVYVIDIVWIDGEIAWRIRNSWTDNWPSQGAGGYSIIQGRRRHPDDSVCPATAKAA